MLILQEVEKMGPLRGDGSDTNNDYYEIREMVEKMGPLRGDGRATLSSIAFILFV